MPDVAAAEPSSVGHAESDADAGSPGRGACGTRTASESALSEAELRLGGCRGLLCAWPAAGGPDLWPRLKPAMSRPINCTKVAEQQDHMLTYATGIRTGTASTEAILRPFMKANATHPTYQAMIGLGRAQKTGFLARYLRSRGFVTRDQ